MNERSYSVMVVDDNEMNRDMLSRRLERTGYNVLVASNGKEALDLLAIESVDLVLLDIMMPQMNGYEVLEHLKSDSDLKHIPVIMTTALDESDGIAKCMALGAADYLTKPFNPVQVKLRVAACLDKSVA